MAVITLTGPTCAGKSTVELALQKMGVGRAISHTTRTPRAGEVDGTHYHFVSKSEFKRLNALGAFVESVEFGGNGYAMSGKAIKTAIAGGAHAAIVVDPHGADQILSYCALHGIDTCAVWIDCGARQQARRWINRITSDMLIGNEAVAAHATRLEEMMTTEQKWRQDAANGTILGERAFWAYDMSVVGKTQPSPEDIATQILEVVDLKLHVRTPFRPHGDLGDSGPR